jgi:hypothetical protein
LSKYKDSLYVLRILVQTGMCYRLPKIVHRSY